MDKKRPLPTTTYDEADLFSQRVTDAVGDRRFAHCRRESWDCENPDNDPPEDFDASQIASTRCFFYDKQDYIATIELDATRSRAFTYIASDDLDLVANYGSEIKKVYKPIVLDNPNIIPIKFWSLSHRGPTDTNRKIEVPQWEDIKDNYAGEASEKLAHLMNGFIPSKGGQLLLWYGNPGTGKTYAIRAMVSKWRDWCTTEYIVDPDKFFQTDASYMMEVLLKSNQQPWEYDETEDKEKWRLLIFEDTGELLNHDAKERSGQALSRLLNVVDGLIGQGLKVLLLITTNEEVEALHPAVSRPGRAAIKIPFEPFEPAESISWASRHGFEVDPEGHHLSLADLYAKKNNFEEGGDPKPARRIGFIK